jgi:hypothetical protein
MASWLRCTPKKLRCVALFLNLLASIFLYFAISVGPATDAASGIPYTFPTGGTVAMVTVAHPWFVPIGWFLMMFGFFIQLALEVWPYAD